MEYQKLNRNKFLTLLGGCFASLGALFIYNLQLLKFFLLGKISK